MSDDLDRAASALSDPAALADDVLARVEGSLIARGMIAPPRNRAQRRARGAKHQPGATRQLPSERAAARRRRERSS